MKLRKSQIKDTEGLYRINKRSTPTQWDREKNRPAPALFIDPDGMSVYRDANGHECQMSEYQMLEHLHTIFDPRLTSVIRVNAKDCRSINACPKPLNNRIDK